jgi:riboflavin synthase
LTFIAVHRSIIAASCKYFERLFFMFTGLIESVCQVKSLGKTSGSMQITIDLGSLVKDTRIGESISINGVCLTVTSISGQVATFDVSGQTLERSAIATLKIGDKVNVERAMLATARFGGHFVQGHIDGTAKIKNITRQGQFAEFQFAAGCDLLNQMVPKGSVAIDGISLTIASMDANSFTVAVIPQTLCNTTLAIAKAGDIVNIETDIITKVVKKQLEAILPAREALSMDKLRQMGF